MRLQDCPVSARVQVCSSDPALTGPAPDVETEEGEGEPGLEVGWAGTVGELTSRPGLWRHLAGSASVTTPSQLLPGGGEAAVVPVVVRQTDLALRVLPQPAVEDGGDLDDGSPLTPDVLALPLTHRPHLVLGWLLLLLGLLPEPQGVDGLHDPGYVGLQSISCHKANKMFPWLCENKNLHSMDNCSLAGVP